MIKRYFVCTILFAIGWILPAQTIYEAAEDFLSSNVSGHSVHVAHAYIRNLLSTQNIAYNLVYGDSVDQYESYLIGARDASLCVVVPLRADPSVLALFDRLLRFSKEDNTLPLAILLQTGFEESTALTVIEEAVQRLPEKTPLILLDQSFDVDPMILRSGTPRMGPRYLFAAIDSANTEDIPIVYQGSRLIESINREFFEHESIASILLSKDIPTVVLAGSGDIQAGIQKADTNAEIRELGIERQKVVDKTASLITTLSQILESREKIRRVEWQTQFLTLQYGFQKPIFFTEIQLYIVSLTILAFLLFLLVFMRKGFKRYITLLLRHWKELLVLTGILVISVGTGHTATHLFLSFRPEMTNLLASLLKLFLSAGVLYLLYPLAVEIFHIHRANRFLTVFALFWVIVNVFILPIVSLAFTLHSMIILLCCYLFSISRRPILKVLFLVLAVMPFFIDVVFVRYIQGGALLDKLLNSTYIGNLVIVVFFFPYFCMLARCELLLGHGNLVISRICSFLFFLGAVILCSIITFRPAHHTLDVVERIDIQNQRHSLSLSLPKAVEPYVFTYKDKLFYAQGLTEEIFLLPYSDDGTTISITENHNTPLFRFRIAYQAWEAPSLFRVQAQSDTTRFIPQAASLFSDFGIGSETDSFAITRSFAPPEARASLVVSAQSKPKIRIVLEYPNDDIAIAQADNIRIRASKEYVYETKAE